MAINWDALVIGPLEGIFGEPITYTPVGGVLFATSGVFDDAFHKDAFFDDGSVGVQTTSPTLGVRLSSFTSPPLQNDRVFVVSVNTTYVVREVHPDGHGWVKLVLNKVSSP